MPRPIVIIHGWSDSAASFNPLQAALNADPRLGKVFTITLANWESMNDLVNYDDVVTQLDIAWTNAGLPRTPRSVDVIIHSTGALVIRDWLVRYFGNDPAAPDPTPSPVCHLVMLAPANFGSPLAHKGTSFIGRIVKGWNLTDFFQVGKLILKGLELGSSYSWDLALKDRFGSLNFYDKGAALTTVIVGNTGWTGIASAANEPGSDGTVRVSTANMNAALVFADLTGPAQNPATLTYRRSVGNTAFLVLDGLNHGDVHLVSAQQDPKHQPALEAIIQALLIDDNGFDTYCANLANATSAVYANREKDGTDSYYWSYQNAVFFVHDQFNRHITDYFIEFYNDTSNVIEELFHRNVLQDVHAFTDDNAYRAMLLDIRTLSRFLNQPATSQVKFSLTAQPAFDPKATPSTFSHPNRAGYRTFNDTDIAAVQLDIPRARTLFRPNETVLIETLISRQQNPDIFAIPNLPVPAPTGP